MKHRTKQLLKLTILAVLFMTFFGIQKSFGQENRPDERDVVFLYQEFGLPNSNELKILLVSSYIYRLDASEPYKQYANSPSSEYRTMLTNAFGNKTEQI